MYQRDVQELRSRALRTAIEATPGTVEVLHAVLGATRVVPATRGDFCWVSGPPGHPAKISPSRRDHVGGPEDRVSHVPRYLVRVRSPGAARATGVLTTMHAFSISDDLIP